MKYEIWMEGYQITGGKSGASYVATSRGNTFKEACENHYGNDKLFNKEKLTYWGCQLFDNESDARKDFG